MWYTENISSRWLQGELYQLFGARYYDPVSCIWTG